jgi:hypothetical protein
VFLGPRVACFSVFYLALDSEDGRFTEFHRWLESQNKWMKRLILTIIMILYFTLIAIVSDYFPINN